MSAIGRRTVVVSVQIQALQPRLRFVLFYGAGIGIVDSSFLNFASEAAKKRSKKGTKPNHTVHRVEMAQLRTRTVESLLFEHDSCHRFDRLFFDSLMLGVIVREDVLGRRRRSG